MNRKRAIKIERTPQTSMIKDIDDQIFCETPKPNRHRKIIIEDNTFDQKEKLFTEKKEKHNSAFKKLREKFRKQRITLFNLSVSAVFLTFIFVFFVNVKISKLEVRFLRKLSDFKSVIHDVEKKAFKPEEVVQKRKDIINYATMRKNTRINIKAKNTLRSTILNKILKTKMDPYVLFEDAVSNTAFYHVNGSQCEIELAFSDNINITKIAILHPQTPDRRSAIQDFLVIDENENVLGSFSFLLNESLFFQVFNIPEIKTNKLKLKVLNNHGKKYTTIYKIFVYGEDDE